jgi:hypothetical protein
MVWATKVACCWMTVSSIEVPKPSLRFLRREDFYAEHPELAA